MEFSTIIGIIIAFAAIYYGTPDIKQDYTVYLQLESLILVLGGTIASTLIGTTLKDMKVIIVSIFLMFFNKNKKTAENTIEYMVNLSTLSQNGNKQQLVEVVKKEKNHFLEKAVTMVASGLDKEFIDQTLERYIYEVGKRQDKRILTVRTMGTYAPMFGMAGTVLGVMQVLKNISDIESIVNGMSLALLTTLYGLFLSSILFIPLSHKMKRKSQEEHLKREIIREGILMIIDKEIPLKVNEYLSSYIKRDTNAKEKNN
jgi:chemotaxis protein MotA